MSSKIYTKTGDTGKTGLVGGERVSKNHPRLNAYGDIDELNAHIGAILTDIASDKTYQTTKDHLTLIQHRLFNLGSLFACPEDRLGMIPPFKESWISDLESWIDEYDSQLAPLNSFILPAGSSLATKAHIARTVCRRCERHSTELINIDSLKIPFQFLNRLSDYLFTAARLFNLKSGQPDTEWEK